MIHKKIFQNTEKALKTIIPPKLHPLFTPLKKMLIPKGYNKLTGIWFITWQCNFACPYCWQRENPDVYRKKYQITSSDWLMAWKRTAACFDEIILGISGGEPFAMKGFITMIAELPENIKYDITSNLSFNCDIFLSHEKIRKNCSGVICSFHPANLNNKEKYINNFFAKVLKLKALPNTRVNFVAAPPNLKFYKQIQSFCKNNRIPLHIDRYVPLKNGLKFSSTEKTFAEKILSSDRKHSATVDTTSVLCNGGYSHLVLFPDGSAWPCLNYGEKQQNQIGNFLSREFTFNKDWLKCNIYPLCAGCDYDNIIVKKTAG